MIDNISKLHNVPIQQWISDGAVFKFWGDNVEKQRRVRDLRSDHLELLFSGQLSQLDCTPTAYFLPDNADVRAVKENLAQKQLQSSRIS